MASACGIRRINKDQDITISDCHSRMSPTGIPLNGSSFNLDSSGVAGFFGGDEAISAMATVHLYRGRRWWGWYNSPGSYNVAKRFGRLASSRFWNALFPGPDIDPTAMFELDGKNGPRYIGSQSGTIINSTPYLAYLLSQRCKDLKKERVGGFRGRATRPERVTIVKLEDVSCDKAMPRMTMLSMTFACIPILISAGACAACAVWSDWYSSSMILLGMMSSGLSCFVIGSGKLYVDTVQHQPLAHTRQGDGMLLGEEIVVLIGKEEAVNVVTKGKFALDLRRSHAWDHSTSSTRERDLEKAISASEEQPEYRNIGLCSLLLLAQFLLQLLLIPQGTLFGQIMFLSSLAVSWAYNSFLASLEKEKIQADVLCDVLNKPSMKRYELGTRTMMAVFVTLVLAPSSPIQFLNELLPNDTAVWRIWKGMVTNRIRHKTLGKLQVEEAQWPGVAMKLEENDKELLKILLSDAKTAWDGYNSYNLPSHHEKN
ncbi:hypothetical protein BJ138DRAFT_1141505 [Hygrophoropsis aurantiaca]|uniref:Uncharacterized protein n=1 Tax=Hygrophoropsis aurantiaca TaxID=72124 RepID=A0ACB8AQV2_9AGAM|nr:hypothetical protein BJ138DRAFT_1141505 [Hygrophoropsis aurantiaca]